MSLTIVDLGIAQSACVNTAPQVARIVQTRAAITLERNKDALT